MMSAFPSRSHRCWFLLCVLPVVGAACEPTDLPIDLRRHDAAADRALVASTGGSTGIAGSSASGGSQTAGNAANAGEDGSIAGAGGGDGSISSDASQDAPGMDGACAGGKALSFDGIAASVEVDLGASLPVGATVRTVEMWLYSLPTSWVADLRTPFEYGSNVAHQAFAIDFDVFPMIQVYSWSDDLVFSAPLANQEGWFHIAASYDGTSLRGFINGVEQGAKVLSMPLATPAGVVNIGRSRLVGGSFFDGRIDELRIWNVARSQAEIQASMSSRLTGNEAGLVAYYRFDDGSGAVARDDSKSAKNATLLNQPMWTDMAAPVSCPGRD